RGRGHGDRGPPGARAQAGDQPGDLRAPRGLPPGGEPRRRAALARPGAEPGGQMKVTVSFYDLRHEPLAHHEIEYPRGAEYVQVGYGPLPRYGGPILADDPQLMELTPTAEPARHAPVFDRSGREIPLIEQVGVTITPVELYPLTGNCKCGRMIT